MAAPGVKALDPELWEIILSLLHKPVPGPLSRPARNELRQSALCVAARTCSMFHKICIPLIYETVVTDDLPLFLRDFNRKSRRRAIAHTRRLFVEYRDDHQRPDYFDILVFGGGFWEELSCLVNCDVDRNALSQEWVLHKSSFEIFRLASALSKVIGRGAKAIFPNLATVAVSSIYGVPSDIWIVIEELYREHRYEALELNPCRQRWACFLEESGVQQYCCRDIHGPLGTSPLPLPRLRPDKVPQLHSTAHFKGHLAALPVRAKVPMRWILDETVVANWEWLYKGVLGQLARHNMARLKVEPEPDPELERLHLDIYCSTDDLGPLVESGKPVKNLREIAYDAGIPLETGDHVGLETQRAIAREVGSYVQALSSANAGREDTIRWHASQDTPVCLSCGSGPLAFSSILGG